MSTFVVFGATGYAGGHIARELAARGHRVVAVSRQITPADAPEGGEARAGSIADAGLRDTVAQGADGIVVALRHRASGETPELAQLVPELLATAATAGARLGIVGGAGSLNVAPGGPRLVTTPEFPAAAKPEAEAAARTLDTLRAADTEADWFFVSPAASFGSYNPGERTGAYRVGGDELVTDEAGASNISGADFAIAFADEFEQPAHHRARFTVAY